MCDGLCLLLWDSYAVLQGLGGRPRPKSGPRPDGPPLGVGPEQYWSARFYADHVCRNLLPFWAAHAVDREYGGFITHLDRAGRVYAVEAEKSSAMQARMVYAFSAGHELDTTTGSLDLARHGVQFLIEHLWDHELGGWYERVHRNGLPARPEKQLFSQAYVLVGLSEYYRVTRDPASLRFVERTWELLDRHAWDEPHQGYVESCQRDWTVSSARKTACVQLDLLAAAISLHEGTGAARDLNRARRIADLIVTRMRDRRHGCVLEVFHPNWLYHPAATADRIQFGHNLKAAWHLLQLYRTTGERNYFLSAERLLRYCIRHGWDRRWHGFYQHGYRNGIIAYRQKLWWPECEAMPPLVLMYRLTGDPVYRTCFLELADFCFRCLVDPVHGEWFTSCHEGGTVHDSTKGGHWKAAFHTVYGCSHASRELHEVADTGP